jgi:ubiquinone/menaquinone biosynthesis C-methylase UbiE
MKAFTLTLGSIFLLAFGLVWAQPEPPKKTEKDRYEIRKEHDPHGIGKFYMGREIAQVMGYQGASWLERPEREREEQVSKLMPSLEVKPGDVVADFGAGSGFHTMKLSKLVGEKGKVYAVDIQPEMLDIIGKRVRKEKITNVVLVHNTEKDAKLAAGKIDMILMVDVYHELSYPYEVALELVKALKPGGRLIFVEFRLEDKNVPILDVHRMSIKQVMKEMAPHALKHAKTLNHLPWQHVIIFEKVEATKEPMPANEDASKKENRCRDRNRDQQTVFRELSCATSYRRQIPCRVKRHLIRSFDDVELGLAL